jgi:hypothetical protein
MPARWAMEMRPGPISATDTFLVGDGLVDDGLIVFSFANFQVV